MEMTNQNHDDATQSVRRLVRKALFQEELQQRDKELLGVGGFSISPRDALTSEERASWNNLTETRQKVVELLLAAGGDVKRAHEYYDKSKGAKTTLAWFRVECKRAGAGLKGGTYSNHNKDADGIPYSARNPRRRQR